MPEEATMTTWWDQPPEAAVVQALARLRRAPGVMHVAVMPDVHLAAGVSNGVVVATADALYPAAVGGDIGCGFAAVAFDGPAAPLDRRAAAESVLAALPRAVPVIRHARRGGLPELDGTLAPNGLADPAARGKAASVGREELGTLGRGNHFLEFQEDDAGRLWAMVHSGSRAMGQLITSSHLRRARSVGGGLAWLDAESDDGAAYLNDVSWARRYAAESRQRMLQVAADIVEDTLGCEMVSETWMNTDHNHVQREEHDGRMVWVHRKGANRATPGLVNMIPGSMATHTVHVEGRGEPQALMSSSHGAGRRLSRSVARSLVRRKDLARQLAHVWVDPRTATRMADESPAAYKDLDAVMRAQKPLVRIIRRLRPVLCYKGV